MYVCMYSTFLTLNGVCHIQLTTSNLSTETLFCGQQGHLAIENSASTILRGVLGNSLA